MRISDVLRTKGTDVVTITSSSTVGELIDLLTTRGIGAVVVMDEPGNVAGIVSERDVVRNIGSDPGALLGQQVSALMSSNVLTCEPGEEIEVLAARMTEHRFRHLPVVEDGKLAGIVSIGDVVKHRLDELQAERDHLSDYING